MISKLTHIKVSIFCVLVLTGCNPGNSIIDSDKVHVPATFGQSADSSGIALKSRNVFFTDTNLVHLIDTALRYNFDLKRAIQNVEISNIGFKISRRRYLPSISLLTSGAIDKYSDYTMNGVGNDDTNLSPNTPEDRKIPKPTYDYFLGLRSTWEVGLWGKYKNVKKAAFSRFLSTQKGRHLVTTSLVAEVANLYYELLALDNELLTIRKNILLQEKAYEIIQIMKDGARANKLAVLQFKAQLLDTRSLEIRTQQEILRIENSLNALLGRFPQAIVRGKPIRQQVFPDNVVTGIPAAMIQRRPDIQQAEFELAATRYDLKVARAAFFPSLTISAYAGANAFDLSKIFTAPASIAAGALAGLAAPLYNGNIIRGDFRRARAMQLNAFYTYQKAIVNGFQEVNTSMNGIANYEKIYRIKEQEVESLLNAVDVSNELFLAGASTYLEVITAQKYVLQSELDLSEARKQQYLSLIELYRSLGGGWE